MSEPTVNLRGYGIITGTAVAGLTQAVNEAMQDGFIPVGGLTLLPGPINGSIILAQAIYINIQVTKEEADQKIAKQSDNSKKLFIP